MNNRNSNNNNKNSNDDINSNKYKNLSSNSMKGKDNESDEEEKFAIAEYDFITSKVEELSFRIGDRIRIINWNFKEGWAYGCKCDDSSKKGAFPKPLVILENNNKKKNNNENEYNKASDSSNKKSSKALNKGINEKMTRPSSKLNDKSYISVSQSNPTIIPNQQPNQAFMSMSNIPNTQEIVATAPDESVLHYASAPNDLYVQQSIQQYPTAPGELHLGSPYQQESQSSPQNYTNSYVGERVPHNYSTIRYNVDEPPPSYESIMKE